MHEAPESSPPPQDDSAAIFLTHAWEERLEIIRHLIDHSRQILLILGEGGSGKTTLRNHLARIAPAAWRTVVIDAVPFDNAATLLERLAAGLGLTLTPKDNLDNHFQALQDHLQALHQTGALPVALIDDAHQLPADALLLLLRLATLEHAAASRVVLFCNPRVTRLLESPQLQAFQRTILHTVEMPAYTEEETAAFLVWRYTRTGRDPGQLIEAGVRAVYQASQGLPGRIQALDTGVDPIADVLPPPPDAVAYRHPYRLFHICAVVFLVLLAVMAVFIWRGHPLSEKPQPSAAVAEIPSLAAVTAPVTATTSNAPVETSPAPVAAAPTKESPTMADSKTHQGDKPMKISPTPGPDTKEKATAKGTAPIPKSTASAGDNTRMPKDGAWLRKQPQDRYVIQLFGSHDQSAALKYAQRSDLAGHTAIYTTLRDQQTLYVVVYGLYASRAEAVSASSRLPAEVARLKPFPRSVGEVQRLMTTPQ
jgi:DamX protein